MPLHLYRRFPIRLYYIVYFIGGLFGLQYLLPSRLYRLWWRVGLLLLVGCMWWAFLCFHETKQYLYRELCLLFLVQHYCFSLLYVWCFGEESLTLLSSELKEKRIELLRRWQHSGDWKSTLQV